ncbi:alpha/beta fold hydrolase [Pseudomonas marincola]|uniref:alpha/beta fold hydrolase n=1 Tax=Pseudomonas marincola TaxID=437900 RepID=UPI0008E5948D|nr:alpha/beta hydrolase [Pseudomonas marincola]SFU04767.1 Pimeloyl-ACP methyl ester carboxylesterase [Pseudomonas marincola]
MSYFDNDGCQLHYEEYGEGKPLLLVHGLGSSTLDWEYQIGELARHYHVFAIDLRGHGRSDKPREAYSMEIFAADVVALIEHLNLPPVHLVGISMGGMIGFQIASQNVDLLSSLTIINSSPEVKAKKPADYIQIAKRWTLARVMSLETLGKALGKLLFPKAEQADLRRKVEERWPRNDKRAYLASLNAIIGWGVREHLARITCPTLVISADKDYTPVALKQAYVSEMPNARLEVISDSRHATPMDQPLEFNKRLLAFLSEVDTINKNPA